MAVGTGMPMSAAVEASYFSDSESLVDDDNNNEAKGHVEALLVEDPPVAAVQDYACVGRERSSSLSIDSSCGSCCLEGDGNQSIAIVSASSDIDCQDVDPNCVKVVDDVDVDSRCAAALHTSQGDALEKVSGTVEGAGQPHCVGSHTAASLSDSLHGPALKQFVDWATDIELSGYSFVEELSEEPDDEDYCTLYHMCMDSGFMMHRLRESLGGHPVRVATVRSQVDLVERTIVQFRSARAPPAPSPELPKRPGKKARDRAKRLQSDLPKRASGHDPV